MDTACASTNNEPSAHLSLPLGTTQTAVRGQPGAGLVRLAGRHTPIIGLTASVRDEDREKALAAGMDAFLGKPFTQKELETALRAVIRS